MATRDQGDSTELLMNIWAVAKRDRAGLESFTHPKIEIGTSTVACRGRYETARLFVAHKAGER